MENLLKNNPRFKLIVYFVLAIHLGVFLVQFPKHLKTVRVPAPIKIQFAPEEVQPLLDKSDKKQIVQSEDSYERDTKAKRTFLSDKNRFIDRETVARRVDVFKSAAATKQGSNNEKSKQVNKGKRGVKDLQLSDLARETLSKFNGEKHKLLSGETGATKREHAQVGLSSSNDYIKDVKLGDFTAVNTVEYKYYGFFHRIRQRLEQFWGNTLRDKAENLYRSGRKIASNDQYITALVITINAVGKIVNVQVRSSSGVKELDDAAIESFNKAGPFPNPPTGLLVDGKAIIEWGFVVNS